MTNILNYLADDILTFLCPHCGQSEGWYEYKTDRTSNRVVVAKYCPKCNYHTNYYYDKNLAICEWDKECKGVNYE